MNKTAVMNAFILCAFAIPCSVSNAQEQLPSDDAIYRSIDVPATGVTMVALPTELTFISPDSSRITLPAGSYDVISTDGANLKLVGTSAEALVKADMGTHHEALTSHLVLLIPEAGVTHVVMLLPNGTTLDASAFPGGVVTRDSPGVLIPQQIGSSNQLKTLQRVYQITPTSDEMAALLDTDIKSAFNIVASPTQLYRVTHFLSPGGDEVTMAPGPYRIERRDASSLRLIAVDGSESVIAAQPSEHDENLKSPEVLSISTGEDEHHVLVLQPDGTSLDAAGTYSGVVPRATVRVSRTRLSKAQTSQAYQYQRTLRYQRVQAGSILQRGDLQITNVAHPGPNAYLVNNPDIPIPDSVSQQTKVLDYGPNEGTLVLPRSRYTKATVTNVGTNSVVLPDQFRYLGGASYAQHGNSNTVTGASSFAAGTSRIIELQLKIECPRAPQLKSGSSFGYGLVVDPQNKLAETNESNNSWAKAAQNPYASNQYNLADLVIDRVFFSNNGSFSGRIDMHVVIRNQGSHRAILCAPLSSGGDIHWKSTNPLSAHANDANFEQKDYSYHVLLEPGQVWDSVRYQVNAYRRSGTTLLKEITRGCYRFSVEINPNGSIPESNRENNTAIAYYKTDAMVQCYQRAQASRLPGMISKRALEAEPPELIFEGVAAPDGTAEQRGINRAEPFDMAVDEELIDFIVKRDAEPATVQIRAGLVANSRARILSTTGASTTSAQTFGTQIKTAGLEAAAAHIEAVRKGDAADPNLVSKLMLQSRQSWPNGDVIAAIFYVFRESIQETNRDKRYWLSRLERLDAINRVLGQYLKELNDAMGSGSCCDHDPGELDTSMLDPEIRPIADQMLFDQAWLDGDAGITKTTNRLREIENLVNVRRQAAAVSLQNFDQKANQIYNVLVTVMKAMRDMETDIIRNLK